MQETLNLVFCNHPKLLEFLFEANRPQLRLESQWLLIEAAAFSSAEQTLIRIGLDRWNGSGRVSLWDIIERLDVYNFQSVIAGLCKLKRIDDEECGIVWRQPKMAYYSEGRHSYLLPKEK
jgi:hypothetical protein